MELKTKPFGVINIEEKQKITFTRGIFGFDNIREYALLNASQWPFFWLQAIDVPDLAFILIDPLIFRPDYTLDVDESDLLDIELTPEDRDKMLVFSIVTVPDDQKKMTANLQGPVIINREKRTGRQFISTNQKWSVRHFIMDELAEKGGSKC